MKVLSEFLAVEIALNEIIPDIPKQEVIDPNDGFTNQVSHLNLILSSKQSASVGSFLPVLFYKRTWSDKNVYYLHLKTNLESLSRFQRDFSKLSQYVLTIYNLGT